MRVVTNGRTDLDDYFRLSGIREHKKLPHTPFLVFVVVENIVEIQIVDSASKLLEFPDGTQVMAQWRGQWKSDFFKFTVGDLREYIVKTPPNSHQVV